LSFVSFRNGVGIRTFTAMVISPSFS